jgi:hypothetical protein
VDIDMNTGFEDSLKQLKLEDGVEGVQRLKAADEISEFLPNPVRKHLHIVVERPSDLSATALVPHRELCLFCWVQGDNPQQTFKLSIPANEHVSDLRKAIRKEKHNAFRGVDADTLMLWKVNAFHCLCEQLLTTRPRTG